MPFPIPDDRLNAMLREDAPGGDATAGALGRRERPGRAVFRMRAAPAPACIEEAERMLLLAVCREARRLASSGCQVEAGVDALVASAACAAPAADLPVTLSPLHQEHGR